MLVKVLFYKSSAKTILTQNRLAGHKARIWTAKKITHIALCLFTDGWTQTGIVTKVRTWKEEMQTEC